MTIARLYQKMKTMNQILKEDFDMGRSSLVSRVSSCIIEISIKKYALSIAKDQIHNEKILL